MPQLNHDIDELKATLLKMAVLAKQNVSNSIKALINRDDDLARRVKQDDDAIDKLEIEVDEKSLLLLAKAPLARDLRLIAIALKASHDLERVGDESVTIARRTIELNKEAQLKDYVDIPNMTKQALEMMDEALEAFVNADVDLARAVIPKDKVIDKINKVLHTELAEYMAQNTDSINRCLHLMTVSRSLERVADHAKNIAEEVVFLYEGRDIRHETNLEN